MEHYTDGLWIEGVTPEAESSIKQAFCQFQAQYNIGPEEWQLRVFPETGQEIHRQLRVWVGRPPQPTFRWPYTIDDDFHAGKKVLEILESLMEEHSA
jgi:hypothetical protein